MDAQTPTGYTILGFLALQPRSGYEIREAAQRSVRLFWGISEGQLYPQLHHLHDSGLIEPLGDPTGPRSSQQWRVTDTGRQTLHEWLAAPSAPIQIRDENLVKLMFSDQLGSEATLALLEERRKVRSPGAADRGGGARCPPTGQRRGGRPAAVPASSTTSPTGTRPPPSTGAERPSVTDSRRNPTHPLGHSRRKPTSRKESP